MQFDISHSFYPKKYNLSANVGFNNRTLGFSDELRFGAEVRFLLNKFIPILKINSIFSFYNGNGNNVQNALFSNNTEYISPTVELNYRDTHINTYLYELNKHYGKAHRTGYHRVF